MTALKAILPTVEMVNIKDDYWWMLDYRPTAARVRQGQRLQKFEWDRLKQGLPVRTDAKLVGEIMAAGYTLIGRYRFPGAEVPIGYLEGELRQKVAATQAELNRLGEEALAEADGSAHEGRRNAAIQDFLDAEGRSLFRHAKRQTDGVSVHTVPEDVN